MSNAKAKKVLTIHEKHYDMVEYEYRGKHYQVMYSKNWTLCCTPPHIQHRNEQAKIDAEIEREKREASKEQKYEDTADYGFEVFWNYVNS